jgi:TolB protein
MRFDPRKRRPDLFRQRKPRGPLLPVSIVVIIGLIALLSLIKPFSFFTTVNPANVTVPAFTPTPTSPPPSPMPTDVHGGHIVFTCTRGDINQICMIRADGTGFAQLTHETNNGYYPVLSPDARSVVFALNQYDLFNLNILTLDDENLRKLADNIGNSFSPDFSPDGNQVVFVNRVGVGHSALWVVGSRGQQPHALYNGPKDIVGAAWSPDGAWIAFTMEVDTPYSYEVFLLDVQHPEVPPRRISHGLAGIGGSLDWSADGSNLVIFAGPVAAREVYRMDVPSGQTTQLTFGGNNAAPCYSPDGQYIVFNSLRNNNQADLYIIRADGHSTRQLTSDPEPDWQPHWGP